jgi:hypothetical protein
MDKLTVLRGRVEDMIEGLTKSAGAPMSSHAKFYHEYRIKEFKLFLQMIDTVAAEDSPTDEVV